MSATTISIVDIFAEGATIEIAATVQNIGTAASPATTATWRSIEGIAPFAKVSGFSKLDPVENVGALGLPTGQAGAKKNVPREIYFYLPSLGET
ncbi:MAG: hypothetical protein HYY10_00230 [Candidatus Liptonbacteria bacterium]|nr:hypothetical protein [Candidatus Liptonbacteria bacterium]